MITDPRRLAAFGMIFVLAAGFVCGDWRSELAAFFSDGRDYAGAAGYMEGIYGSTEEEYVPTLCALLAYSYARMERTAEEHAWLKVFFEKYRGMSAVFSFLDPRMQMDLSTYLGRWHRDYPLILDLFLVEQTNPQSFSPPAQIVLGIEINNSAYYKVLKNEQIVVGSMLHRGFNIIRVDASRLFEQPGVHVYRLQIKKDDLDLSWEVRLDVDVTTPQFRTSPQAQAKKIEYTLSLYVGSEMISSFRKIERLQTPIKLGFSNNALKGGKFDPLHRADPQGHPDPLSNSISIPALVQGVASIIKDLFNKKDEQPGEPRITRSMTQEFRYFRRLYGMDRETTAKITLETRSLDLIEDR